MHIWYHRVIHFMRIPLFILSVVMCVGLLIAPFSVSAVGVPFGGQITIMRPCLTGAGFQMIVRRGPIAYPLTYYPGRSLLYAKYKPIPGSFVVGKFLPGGFCDGFPSIGTVMFMGTS